MQYKIKLAELGQKAELLGLYQSMIGMPGCTWNEHYPNMEIAIWDIESKNIYCICDEDNEIISAASVCRYDALYDYGEEGLDDVKCYKSVEKWVELARFAVNKSFQGQGYGKILLNHIIYELKKQGLESIRLLVSEGNTPALALYKNLGFKECGEVYMYEQDWLCYELILLELSED